MIDSPRFYPLSVELLVLKGIAEQLLVEQCRVPYDIFRTVVSRQPDTSDAAMGQLPRRGEDLKSRVVSLLERKVGRTQSTGDVEG